MMKIAVIGAGIAGLTAGYRLAKQGHEVDLFEASDHVGGLAAGFQVAGTSLEKYYHHIFTSDIQIRALVDELDIHDDLHWLTSQMGFFHEGKIYLFGTPFQLLTFKPLPFLARIWFGLQALYLGKVDDWKKYEKVTAYAWLKKYAGRHILKVVWEPLLRSKFGEFFDKVAMAWFWARVHVRAKSRKGSVEKLGYFKGGFDVFNNRLAAAFQGKGGKLFLKTAVERILTAKGKFEGLLINGQKQKYDRLVFTAATPIFLKACPELPKDYSDRLSQLHFIAAQCLILVMKRPFSSIYWMNISDMEVPFLALVEHTNFAPGGWYQDKHIMYIGNYLSKTHRFFCLTKEELLAEFMPHLQKINPEFNQSLIEETFLFRDTYAQPVVPLNYSEIMPDFRTPVENIFLANMSLVYPEDRGTNYAVDVGNKVSRLVDPLVAIPGIKESP
jgi:protoporphyrinogen oxidase